MLNAIAGAEGVSDFYAQQWIKTHRDKLPDDVVGMFERQADRVKALEDEIEKLQMRNWELREYETQAADRQEQISELVGKVFALEAQVRAAAKEPQR